MGDIEGRARAGWENSWLRRCFVWSMSREQLDRIKRYLLDVNLRSCIYTNLIICILILGARVYLQLDSRLALSSGVLEAGFVIGLVLMLLSLLVKIKGIRSSVFINSLVACTLTLVLISGSYIGASDPDAPAIIYHVGILIIQVVFIQYPVFSVAIPAASTAAFITASYFFKSTDVFHVDIFYGLLIALGSALLGLRQSKLVVDEKIAQRQLKEWGNEIYFRSHAEYRTITRQALSVFANAIDAKDKYTNGHSTRVAVYSREIARRSGMTIREQENIYYMGLLHDIGKIGIPDSILTKPSSLTDEEYEIIKKHPAYGAEILKGFTAIEGINESARYHHERIDGKGYSAGLRGMEIPAMVRIISVADTLDALTSDRSYRKRMSMGKVISIIKDAEGTQLDPKYAEIAIKMIQSGFSAEAAGKLIEDN